MEGFKEGLGLVKDGANTIIVAAVAGAIVYTFGSVCYKAGWKFGKYVVKSVKGEVTE